MTSTDRVGGLASLPLIPPSPVVSRIEEAARTVSNIGGYPALNSRDLARAIVETLRPHGSDRDATRNESLRGLVTPALQELDRRRNQELATMIPDQKSLWVQNELESTAKVWRSVWYSDPEIGDRGSEWAGLRLDRSMIWQDVRKPNAEGLGVYFNVAESGIRFLKLPFGHVESYLKGAYTVGAGELPVPGWSADRPATIKLRFVDNHARLGSLPHGKKVTALVDRVEHLSHHNGFVKFFAGCGLIRVPGPYGANEVRGELWNIYVDQDIRIGLGRSENNPNIRMYVLQAGDRV